MRNPRLRKLREWRRSRVTVRARSGPADLASLNDRGVKFPVIADIIEAAYGLGVE